MEMCEITKQLAAAVARAIPETLTDPASYAYPLPSWIAVRLLEEFRVDGCTAEQFIGTIACTMALTREPSQIPLAVATALHSAYKIERKIQ